MGNSAAVRGESCKGLGRLVNRFSVGQQLGEDHREPNTEAEKSVRLLGYRAETWGRVNAVGLSRSLCPCAKGSPRLRPHGHAKIFTWSWAASVDRQTWNEG